MTLAKAQNDNRLSIYQNYVQSSNEWLKAYPSHWELVKLKFLCQINPSKSEINYLPSDTEVSFIPMDNISENGEIRLDQTKAIEDVKNGYTFFRNQDVILAKITPCFENGKGAIAQNLTNGIAFGTTELYVLRSLGEITTKFLYYLTRSTNFRHPGIAMMQGAAGQKRVQSDFIANYQIALPSLKEQRQIATFLDCETQKLDTLIAKK